MNCFEVKSQNELPISSPMDSILIVGIMNYYVSSSYKTIGIVDSISLIHSNNIYRTDKYTRTEYEVQYYTDKTKPKLQSRSRNRIVRKRKYNENLIHSLIDAINNPITVEDLAIQIGEENFNKNVTNRFILSIAKEHDVEYYFDSTSFIYPVFGLSYDEIRSIDTFNMYLNEEFGFKGYSFSWHYTNTIQIYLFKNSNCLRIEGNYPNTFKQPWYTQNLDAEHNPKTLLNFEINEELLKVLPNSFLNKKTLETFRLYKDYVEWYLSRRNIVFLE